MRLDPTDYASGGHVEFPYLVVGRKLTSLPGGSQFLQHSEPSFTLVGAERLAARLGSDPDWKDVRVYEYRGYVPVASYD